MSKKNPLPPSMEFYQDNTTLKWIILFTSVIICVGSIYYTNILVNQLKAREKQQVELFAKALEYITRSEESIEFVTAEIIFKNKSIPVIWITKEKEYQYVNIDIDSSFTPERKEAFLKKQVEQMKRAFPPIEMISLNENGDVESYGFLYYKNSKLLTQLTAFPYIQLSVLAIFAFISYMAFNYSRTAEQNQVWVGLAKETAHQLGTPLSSLMAWTEVLRDDPVIRSKGIVEELEKDIKKLTIVTERFSSIGSTPVLKSENIYQLIKGVVGYLQPRVSSKINFEIHTLSETIQAEVHTPLFEWVLENLCKNAIDAMGNTGTISIKILRGGDRRVLIDISDTGKGIPKTLISNVFKPGFTTKKRGWGLGLALAKRIIEMYHEGKIYVKHSEENQGTTFRIELKSSL